MFLKNFDNWTFEKCSENDFWNFGFLIFVAKNKISMGFGGNNNNATLIIMTLLTVTVLEVYSELRFQKWFLLQKQNYSMNCVRF